MASPRLQKTLPGTKIPHERPAFQQEGRKGAGEVIIPPGKCVYFWVGCTGFPYRRSNLCRTHYLEVAKRCVHEGCRFLPWLDKVLCKQHYYEAQGWTPGKDKLCPTEGCERPANALGGPCRLCYRNAYAEAYRENVREYDRKYRANNTDQVRARYRAWRREQGPDFRALHRERQAQYRARKMAREAAENARAEGAE